MILYKVSYIHWNMHARILGWPLINIYLLSYIHLLRTNDAYSFWNWNELITEITFLDCSFHCDIPLNVKTIIHKEMKLFGNYLFSIRFVILYSKKKKCMILHINIFVNFIHKNTLQKRIYTNFIIIYTVIKV